MAALFAGPACALDTGDIFVVNVKGEVHVTMKGAERPVRAGSVLELPASVRTGRDGGIELRQGATTVSVGPETLLEFPSLETPGGPIDRIQQPRGNAFYSIGKRAGRKLRIETPYLVGVVKGTQFNVAAQGDGTTISLFEGLLEVRAADDSAVVDLRAGEIASRRRGDKSISVISMDAGKLPTNAPRAQGNGSNGGNDGPGGPQRGVASPVDRSGGLGVVGADSLHTGASATVGTDLRTPLGGVHGDAGAVTADVTTGTSVNAGPVGADLSTSTSVGVSTGGVSVDNSVNTSVAAGPVGVDVSTSTSVDVGTAGVAADVGATAGVSAGPVAVDTGASTAVDVGATGVSADVGTSTTVDAGPISAGVDAGAAVDVGTSGVSADVGAGTTVDAGPISAGVDTGAAVDVGTGGVSADLGAATAVDAGPVTADLGTTTTVDAGTGTVTVETGASLGTVAETPVDVSVGVSAGVDVSSGSVDLGVSVGGADLGLNVDLGLGGSEPATDTESSTTTATDSGNTGSTDVGGLLDGLLRRPGRK